MFIWAFEDGLVLEIQAKMICFRTHWKSTPKTYSTMKPRVKRKTAVMHDLDPAKKLINNGN